MFFIKNIRKSLYPYKVFHKSLCFCREMALENRILIGTHHKTGTVWMGSIFSTISRWLSLTYCKSGLQKYDLPKEFHIFLNNHSKFNFDSFRFPFRGLHIVRDPRDVIVSACFYHQKAKEEWLHEPKEKFNGLTYQQKINSYNTLGDRFLFEMEHSAGGNIRNMLEWDYTRRDFMEIKYENLIQDVDLKLFHEIFLFLGFPGSAIPVLLTIAYNKSLFSNQLKKNDHIRSGKIQQWKQYFNKIHKERFLELFGDGLIQLGYEQNNNWSCEE